MNKNTNTLQELSGTGIRIHTGQPYGKKPHTGNRIINGLSDAFHVEEHAMKDNEHAVSKKVSNYNTIIAQMF